MKSKNERITENIVRDFLFDLGYKNDENIVIEEQKSESPIVQKCLKNASKAGKGVGKPEFLIRHNDFSDFIIVVECKADKAKHQSATLDQYKDFAVDGVLNYASCFSKQFNVIAIGVSGQSAKDVLIDTFLWVKNEAIYTKLQDNNQKPINEFLKFEKYIGFALYDHRIEKARVENLTSFSRELHNFIRDYGKLTEAEKPLLVSGILIALMDNAFKFTYPKYKQTTELPSELLNAIRRQFEEAEIPKSKTKTLIQPYSFIAVHPELQKMNAKLGETPLLRIIDDINSNVRPFFENHLNFDVLGQFYGEFLRYTGGDGKGLGIVLTPTHITQLFAKLANLTSKSVVLDTCAGTSGFLISAMYEMIRKAKNQAEIDYIKQTCLLGVEQQPNMFALAASNMILRGDGKANLFQGDCFDEQIVAEISGKADVGMINPPYSQKGEDLHELDFVYNLLNCLKPNGVGLAIVPMSCAISPNPLREKLLEKHRLEAVLSMPDDLFHPVGVVACIMIFTAHVPHEQNQYHETWFGYWKNDGFIKTKHKGRIDGGTWEETQERWLDAYFKRSEIAGFSVKRKITASDEWCVEAFMETDYSTVSENDFLREVKKFVAFKVVSSEFFEK